MRAGSPSITVSPSGLVISIHHPWIAASPDGLVNDPSSSDPFGLACRIQEPLQPQKLRPADSSKV